jgi:hypothetical protein
MKQKRKNREITFMIIVVGVESSWDKDEICGKSLIK